MRYLARSGNRTTAGGRYLVGNDKNRVRVLLNSKGARGPPAVGRIAPPWRCQNAVVCRGTVNCGTGAPTKNHPPTPGTRQRRGRTQWNCRTSSGKGPRVDHKLSRGETKVSIPGASLHVHVTPPALPSRRRPQQFARGSDSREAPERAACLAKQPGARMTAYDATRNRVPGPHTPLEEQSETGSNR